MSWLTYRVRAEVRTRWRSLLALALFVALIGGVVLTAAAGARRTQTAVDRLGAAAGDVDGFLDVHGTDQSKWDDIGRLPSVEMAAKVAFVYAFPDVDGYFPFLAFTDPNAADVNGGVLVAGRRPNPKAANELVLSEATAKAIGARPGSTLNTVTVPPEDVEAFNESEDYDPAGPRLPLKVVGIVRSGQDIASRGGDPTVTFLSYAFYEKYRDRIGMDDASFLVRFGRDAGSGEVTRDLNRLFAGGPAPALDASGDPAEGLKSSTNVQAVGLMAFAGVFLLFGLAAVAQAMSRAVNAAAGDHQALSAVGLTRRGQFLDAAIPSALTGTVGCIAAVGVAVLASPLLPVGLAGQAEPDPGVRIEPLVLLPGTAALILAVLVVVAWPAWRRSRQPLSGAPVVTATTRPTVASRLTRTSQPALAVGVDMATRRGRGATEVAVRTALVGTLLGALGLAAAAVFSGSLQHLLDTPSRYGWSWDVSASVPDNKIQTVVNRDDVAAVGRAVLNATVRVDDRPINAFAIDTVKGEIPAPVAKGRGPTSSTEIALGAALRHRIGEEVEVTTDERKARYRVVGIALSASPDDPIPMDGGALLSPDGLERLGLLKAKYDSEDSAYRQTLITFREGVDQRVASRTIPIKSQNDRTVTFPRPPAEVAKLDQVRDLPRLLALFLGALAIVALLHALAQTVQRRRVELGVLRAIGFTRRQVAGAIGWQAAALAVVGAAVGLPLGTAVGRWLWSGVAQGLGVAAHPQVAVTLLLVVPIAGAFAALVGLALGGWTGRTTAAAALRAE